MGLPEIVRSLALAQSDIISSACRNPRRARHREMSNSNETGRIIVTIHDKRG